MDVVSIMSFLGVAVLLTLMPGPDNLFVLAQSIAKGKKAGIFTLLGLCTGLIVHITASTVGITAIIYQSAIAFAVVKYAGAAYLLYLAYISFRDKSSALAIAEGSALDHSSLYRKGVIMNILNPKVSLFFLAFFPQFINNAAGHVTEQMLVYGFIFLIQTLTIFSLISVFAGKLGHFIRRSPSIARRINLIQGSIFALIGCKIAFSQK